MEETESEETGGDKETPAGFNSGGEKFLAGFKEYLERSSLSKNTKNLYYNKATHIVAHLEKTLKNWKADKLLFPLETRCTFPRLTGYLSGTDNKATAIKTYKYIQDYTLEMSNER